MKRTVASVGLLVLSVLAWGCAGDGSQLIDDILDSGPSCPPEEPVAAPTLQELQNTVFTPICSSCHVPGGFAPFSLDSVEESFDNLVNLASLCEIPSCQTETKQGLQGQPRVIPCDADNSYLIWKLEDDPRIDGVPMPFGGPGLAATQPKLVDDIRAWIEAGAQP